MLDLPLQRLLHLDALQRRQNLQQQLVIRIARPILQQLLDLANQLVGALRLGQLPLQLLDLLLVQIHLAPLLRHVHVVAGAPAHLVHVRQRVDDDQDVVGRYAEEEEQTRFDAAQLEGVAYGGQKEDDGHDDQEEDGRCFPGAVHDAHDGTCWIGEKAHIKRMKKLTPHVFI